MFNTTAPCSTQILIQAQHMRCNASFDVDAGQGSDIARCLVLGCRDLIIFSQQRLDNPSQAWINTCFLGTPRIADILLALA